MKLLLISIMLIAGCVDNELSSVMVNGKTYEVEIADSSEERSRGLMNREFLPEDKGMLFVFENEDYRSFWMKNTLIPLDIIFISSDFKVVDVVTLEPCNDVCISYESKEKAMYVLEVNEGSGIKKGEVVSLER